MSATIFPAAELNRKKMRWDDHLYDLTPVECVNGRWYKREDMFAPLGYGGINGSKLRQLIWLVDGYVRSGGGAGVLTGASVHSPQVSMGALVATHYGLPVAVVLGATYIESAIKHENVRIAAQYGTEFLFTPVAYNPALQRAVSDLHAEPEYADYYRLCYGITTADDADDEEIAAFHEVGAPQVKNIPDEVTTLLIPAGSCNSVTSILYGLAKYGAKNVERVVLFGIGPTRLLWIHSRIDAITRATGVEIATLFTPEYHDQPALEANLGGRGALRLEHYDLHATKFARYDQKMPYHLDGIDFHPTYEGKVLTYLEQRRSLFPGFWEGDGKHLFWVVGSRPTLAAMA